MRSAYLALGLALASPMAMIAVAPQAVAQSAIQSQRVTFKSGQSSAVITRTIRGRETVDFLVNAREGQQLVVSMRSNNRSAYFNLIAPGESDVAFYTGDMSAPLNSFSGIVPKSGDLKVRVYLFRAAARRGERATITLSIAVRGTGGAATPPPIDALVPGTAFHATTQLQCSFDSSVPTSRCAAGVRRRAGADGSTFVEVTRPDGRKRIIFFQGNHAYGADSAQSDGSAAYRFQAVRRGDATAVEYGPERYVIPDAFVIGG